MPTYTYICPACGHRYDLFLSISDSGEKRCPECGEVAKRQFGGGGGFSGLGTKTGLSSAPSAPHRHTGFT